MRAKTSKLLDLPHFGELPDVPFMPSSLTCVGELDSPTSKLSFGKCLDPGFARI